MDKPYIHFKVSLYNNWIEMLGLALACLFTFAPLFTPYFFVGLVVGALFFFVIRKTPYQTLFTPDRVIAKSLKKTVEVRYDEITSVKVVLISGGHLPYIRIVYAGDSKPNVLGVHIRNVRWKEELFKFLAEKNVPLEKDDVVIC